MEEMSRGHGGVLGEDPARIHEPIVNRQAVTRYEQKGVGGPYCS